VLNLADPTDDVDLAALIATRICHDLVSPVGAVVNGISLIQEMSGANCSEETALIGQSAHRASRLLQFYRIAFGEVTDDAADILSSVIRDHAISLLSTRRVSVELEDTRGLPLPRAKARMLCLLILVARALAGRRSQVRIAVPCQGGLCFVAVVEPVGDANVAQFLPLLENSTSESVLVLPRAIEFMLLARAAKQQAMSIDIYREGGIVVLQLREKLSIDE
jgi:histidine phosphotransferase ChpT